MPFSAKTEYGLVALMDLATAHATGDLVQTGEICRRHAIPERYLEQMLTALRKGGFLKSVRGPRGGFLLARPPEQIRIIDVEWCLEGEVSPARKGERQDPEFQALSELIPCKRGKLRVFNNTGVLMKVKVWTKKSLKKCESFAGLTWFLDFYCSCTCREQYRVSKFAQGKLP